MCKQEYFWVRNQTDDAMEIIWKSIFFNVRKVIYSLKKAYCNNYILSKYVMYKQKGYKIQNKYFSLL
ncbi:hypothetical protein C2W64_01843 [Brevibacillus laterosporus]|nr:hypothetical protein C2W64_01843 [Brevibacillus laterosporus]